MALARARAEGEGKGEGEGEGEGSVDRVVERWINRIPFFSAAQFGILVVGCGGVCHLLATASGTPRHNPQPKFQTPEQKKRGFN